MQTTSSACNCNVNHTNLHQMAVKDSHTKAQHDWLVVVSFDGPHGFFDSAMMKEAFGFLASLNIESSSMSNVCSSPADLFKFFNQLFHGPGKSGDVLLEFILWFGVCQWKPIWCAVNCGSIDQSRSPQSSQTDGISTRC